MYKKYPAAQPDNQQFVPPNNEPPPASPQSAHGREKIESSAHALRPQRNLGRQAARAPLATCAPLSAGVGLKGGRKAREKRKEHANINKERRERVGRETRRARCLSIHKPTNNKRQIIFNTNKHLPLNHKRQSGEIFPTNQTNNRQSIISRKQMNAISPAQTTNRYK